MKAIFLGFDGQLGTGQVMALFQIGTQCRRYAIEFAPGEVPTEERILELCRAEEAKIQELLAPYAEFNAKYRGRVVEL